MRVFGAFIANGIGRLPDLKITEAAALIGVAPGTLRQWEQHGLLTPRRLASGHRLYDEATLQLASKIADLRAKEGLGLFAISAALKPVQAPDLGSRKTEVSRSVPLGLRVRRMRSARKIGLKTFADSLGVSPSLISLFERTSNGVSVTLLRKIADFLGLTVTQLTFAEAAHPNGFDAVLARLGKGIEARRLTTGVTAMDCKEWTLEPGARSDGAYRHSGEEFVYVLSGVLRISVAGRETTVLGEGESLYFESILEHSWDNPGPYSCRLLWINTPPTF